MTKESNVIRFPKDRVDGPPLSPEEVSDRIEGFQTDFVNQIAEILTTNVFSELSRAGCDFSDMETMHPSMILVAESIIALHLRAVGIEHPLQDFADDVYSDDDEDDDEPTEAVVPADEVAP